MNLRRLTRPLRRGAVAVTALLTAAFYAGVPASPAHADDTPWESLNQIANVANSQLSVSINNGGPGTVCSPGYLTSCSGNGGKGEYWCADFARWVWSYAGFRTDGLNATARSFKQMASAYGAEHATPQLGDAVLFHNTAGADKGVVHHVAVVVSVSAITGQVSFVSGDVGGQENTRGPEGDEQAHYAHTAKVRKDTLDWTPGTRFGGTEAIDGYVSPVLNGRPLHGGGGGSTGGSGGTSSYKSWVTTFSSAPGRDHGGTLNTGRNYVFCRVWGTQVGSGSAFNHWWLYTDMDTGGRDFVPAYYLSGQGNDTANDENGSPLPDCDGETSGTGRSGGRYWVRTFSGAPGRDAGGTLNAGRNYVFCRVWGTQVGSGSAFNHWWLYTDMDTGGRDYVSAYYLSGQGNDVANDENGTPVPDCNSGDDGGGRSWVTTFSPAPGRDHGGSLYAGRNYVLCRVWGAQVGSGSAFNHWWLYTDMDTGGRDYVSAYYLSGQGNDTANDENGAPLPDC